MSKRSHHVPQSKKKYAIIGAVLLCVFMFPILFFKITPNPNESIEPLPEKTETKNIIITETPNSISTDHVMTPDELLARITKRNHLKEDLIINDELYERLTAKCEHLSQHQQLLDEECSALWFYHLKFGEITNVFELLGFEDTHWGAIILEVDHKFKAVFKPCSTKSEDTTKEVIASHIDQVLGYGQTAPAIARRVNVETIQKYSTTEVAYQRFLQTKEKCQVDGFFEGPMIGWWNGLTPIRTVKKYKVLPEEFDEMRRNLTKNLETTQLQSRYQSFYWLINILRHGKDEFITPEGDLVSLDLDRSRYSSTIPPYDSSINFTWCYTCYFDKWTYDIFNSVSKQPAEKRLSALMEVSLQTEDVFRGLYTSKLGEVVDTRVEQYLECAERCINNYGRENVILNQKRTMSDKELINWFVFNSEYKNQNGKKAPSWFKPENY